jgi:glycosyltransferase involved in cell wall biosynthesis
VQVERYNEHKNHADLCAEFGLPQDQVLVGSVGRLTQQKGFDVLVHALSLTHRQDIHLLLVGAGEEEKKLQSQAAGLGLEKRVHFTGYRRDVPRLLGALDLYVQPSRFEGMPNALLEAMAAGCAVVSTTVDGNRELIEDGVHGWLVAPEDSAALARAMRAALDDRAEALRRGAAARQRVVEDFCTDRMVQAWARRLEGTA